MIVVRFLKVEEEILRPQSWLPVVLSAGSMVKLCKKVDFTGDRTQWQMIIVYKSSMTPYRWELDKNPHFAGSWRRGAFGAPEFWSPESLNSDTGVRINSASQIT